jgi:hypothetical protein
MRKYLEHLQNKSPHERRQHAMQLSMGIVALLAVAWLALLPLRFMGDFQTQGTESSTQVASVVSATQGDATLMVATSTSY